jgi:hypothetical protein
MVQHPATGNPTNRGSQRDFLLKEKQLLAARRGRVYDNLRPSNPLIPGMAVDHNANKTLETDADSAGQPTLTGRT